MNLAWEKISEEKYRAGHRRILRRVFRLPNRTEDTFDIHDEGRSVSILALTADQHVLIAKQYRPGPEKVVLDLPCGMIEKGESPLIAAKRELLEETGYVGELREIGTCLESAYSTKVRHNFVATNCIRVSEPMLDATEFIDVVQLGVPEFRTLLRSGELTVVETGYLGLDALGML
jgi:ADP-ribose pyrophosphatase